MGVLKDNARITPKDRNAIKGALRRAFARSELHRGILDAAVVKHSDPTRPRVKTWCMCALCKRPEARSYMIVDHAAPVIPIETHFEDMSIEDTVNRLWCEAKNLQAVCETCHDVKTAEERQARKPFAKPRKKKACAKA